MPVSTITEYSWASVLLLQSETGPLMTGGVTGLATTVNGAEVAVHPLAFLTSTV